MVWKAARRGKEPNATTVSGVSTSPHWASPQNNSLLSSTAITEPTSSVSDH